MRWLRLRRIHLTLLRQLLLLLQVLLCVRLRLGIVLRYGLTILRRLAILRLLRVYRWLRTVMSIRMVRVAPYYFNAVRPWRSRIHHQQGFECLRCTVMNILRHDVLAMTNRQLLLPLSSVVRLTHTFLGAPTTTLVSGPVRLSTNNIKLQHYGKQTLKKTQD